MAPDNQAGYVPRTPTHANDMHVGQQPDPNSGRPQFVPIQQAVAQDTAIPEPAAQPQPVYEVPIEQPVKPPQQPQQPEATPLPQLSEAVPTEIDQAAVAAAAEAVALKLSNGVVSRTDISKCLREVETLDEYFNQARIRGSKDQPLPMLGRVLENLSKANNLNMLHAEDRAKLKVFLTYLKARAPVVHMSFPSEANPQFIGRLLEWFRAEIDPHVVLHIGLQPELAAGCTMRITSKYFDFSFRKRFEKSKEKLIAALEASSAQPEEKTA